MLEYALLAACLEHGVNHDLLRAIARQESAGKQNAFYINRWNQDQFKNLSLDEAVMVVETMVEEGYTVDVGLMGINSINIERFGLTVREAFDPCTNVNLGETILHENIMHAESKGETGDAALQAALSMYNTGSVTRGFKNGYVDKVWRYYVQSGFHEANESGLDVPWGNNLTRVETENNELHWTQKESVQ